MKCTRLRTLPASRDGMALIMTIVILSMITIMVLGLATLVRNEVVTSGAHVDRARAQSYSQMGVNMVTGVLRENTADPAKVWATFPGALLVPEKDASGKDLIKLRRQIPLHSGIPSAAAQALDPKDPLAPANLNVQTFNDQSPPTHLITDQHTNPNDATSPIATMPLRWVYVRQDGTMEDTEKPDLTNKDNPLTGRFAWWTDDESSKININTAWKRNTGSSATNIKNPFTASHPTSVNLMGLVEYGMTPEMVDLMHTHVAPEAPYDYELGVKRFFNSVREVRALSAPGLDFTPILNRGKFEMTHYNHDPDTTFFNEPRIVLTTDKDKAKGRPFLDIKKTGSKEMWDPTKQIDDAKLAATIDKLNSYLMRQDWPMAPGSSFQAKYYKNKPERLTQLSLNLINYVRSKESPGDPATGVVHPVRGEQLPGQKFVRMDVCTTPHAFIGITRSPKITEMGLWMSDSTSTNPVTNPDYPKICQIKYKFEVHLPRNFGLEKIDLTKLSAYVSVSGTGIKSESSESKILRAEIQGGKVNLNAGEYATITRSETVEWKSRPTNVKLRIAIARIADAFGSNVRMDIAPLGDPAPCKLDPGGGAEATITSIEVDDPCVNSHRDDWKERDKDNSFGRRNDGTKGGKNISALGAPSSTSPKQDTDRDGNVTDISMQMPAPAPADPKNPPADSKNPSGVVDSVGELGFIHTGMESGAGAGVPWRTLRLQPNEDAPSMVPDWAFMDLFTVPTDVPDRARSIFAPHETSTAGRININAQVQPYGTDQVTYPLERQLPLVALLSGVPKDSTYPPTSTSTLSIADARAIASNIYSRKLADGRIRGKAYGHPDVHAYDSPGEVVEIKGVADDGEESEAVVRGIANLITTRGSVYTIYTVGQTLKQTRNGALTVTAESRQQTMLERYTDATAPDKVRFRRIEHQPVTP
jgi:hypothetical protein